jgi:hypothetical protein
VVARERRHERYLAIGGFENPWAEALAEDERHLAEGVPGGRGFQVGPEDIEEVIATGAPAGERVQVDEECDRLPGAEQESFGIARIEADAP